MVTPLQAQLLKAGLVKADQIKKAERQKRDAAKRGTQTPDPAGQVAEAQQQKAESDRRRNREQQDERERKAQAAQIQQMIETQRVDRSGGESAYQFVEDATVRKIALHEAQRVQLVTGMLAVVKLGSGYELVPVATAEKIAQRDPTRVLVLNIQSRAQSNSESDPYADYSVPDDLMW
ncbi:MAG: DUF2058 domain-containing protein [Immundisolibacter sp.]|uniref:DUF2058 domain-containing protein n=1 Tax=Immundisolibacter sp. TaxID=1934948 RepID=UPI003EE41A8E